MKYLEKCIFECNKCQFNETRDARYCGGVGNDYRVMFIAESPSTSGGTGKYPGTDGFYWGPARTQDDELFRMVRSEYGLENCYTTDLVKCGVASGKPTHEKITNCLPYIKKELEIVNPKVVVAVGKNVPIEGDSYNFAELLRKILDITVPVLCTWHYSYVWNKCQVKVVDRANRKNPEIKKDRMVVYRKQHEEILRYL